MNFILQKINIQVCLKTVFDTLKKQQHTMRIPAGLSILFFYFLSFSSILPAQSKPITIAVSKNSPNYAGWLQRTDSSVIIRDLFHMTVPEALAVLESADGLLMTGGEDIYPGYYGREPDTTACGEINRHRDTLEMSLITRALEMKIPVMAVCRGHQLVNVALGGTLIVDIPAEVRNPVIHRCDDYLHCFHEVNILPETMLGQIVLTKTGEVTTNHHQCIDKPAASLRVSSRSKDGVIESVEWKEPVDKSFLMSVQWHPERMPHTNPLSGKLGNTFFLAAKIYQKKHRK